MKYLKEDLKQLTFKRVYLLYGEERYLVQHYERAFTEKLLDDSSVMMNRDVFNGKDAPIEQILNAANTLPFLSDMRLVYVRDSQLFTAGRKADTETMADFIPTIPESTLLIFIETEVDKRNRLYKKTVDQGRAVEFKTPSERELTDWVVNVFKKKGKEINPFTINKLLRTVSHNMTAVYAEADKLGFYVGDRREITPEDIDRVCSPSLETRVFDLVAAVGGGKAEKALTMYRNMLLLKEQPIMILTMMARQFRMILQCRACADQKMPRSKMAEVLEMRSFIMDECLEQGQNFTLPRLLNALRDCRDMDIRIKTGLIGAEIGVETLIARYASVLPK